MVCCLLLFFVIDDITVPSSWLVKGHLPNETGIKFTLL